MSQLKTKFKWPYLGLSVIVLVSLFLNFYKLGQEGYGNLYYSIAVRSMLDSWHNFFFNTFDPKGFITIDKPPVGFWLQTLSAYLFGFKGWSLFFPQALAGVLSVVLLYCLVARTFGTGAGLLSALFLALTPIVVATDRTNEVDSVLMLVTLIATWAIGKTTERKPLKWLLFAFFLIGVGFNIKMMEAYLVLPAFYLFYLLSTKLTWFKKFVHLVCATVVLVIVSFSWSAVIDSIPAKDRPYVGSTQHNSMIELAIGYNGINRLIGQEHDVRQISVAKQGNSSNVQQRNGYHPNSRLTGRSTKKSNLLRLFTTPELVGQISWLLPSVFISLVSLLWGTRLRGQVDRKRLMVIFWAVWVLTMTVFFSHIANMMNSYYMVMLAPGIAALAGAGLKDMWDRWQTGDKIGAWLFSLTLVANVCFEITVVWMYPSFRTILCLTIVILAMLALVAMLFLQKIKEQNFSIFPIVAGVLAIMTAPALWSISPIQYGGSETKPFAGPELNHQRVWIDKASSPKVEQFLKENYQKGTFLAATLDAPTAAPIMLDTNLPVMAMGGFKGTDPALTVEKLKAMANQGQVRYFLLPGSDAPNDQSLLLKWIRTNCRKVPFYKWQDAKIKFGDHQGWTGSGYSSMVLYEYAKKTI